MVDLEWRCPSHLHLVAMPPPSHQVTTLGGDCELQMVTFVIRLRTGFKGKELLMFPVTHRRHQWRCSLANKHMAISKCEWI